MKRDRKQRKLASKQDEIRALHRITLSRADVRHIDEIGNAVLECERLDDAEVGIRYRLIGDLIHANVTRLDLEEDTLQIVDIAKRIAGELVGTRLRRYWFDSDSCWDKWRPNHSPWFSRKIDGKNSEGDEYMLRSIPDQKIAMVDMALVLLESDPTYRAGALALRKHQEDHCLLPDKFSLRHVDC